MSEQAFDSFGNYVISRGYTTATLTAAGFRAGETTTNLVSRLVFAHQGAPDSFNFEIGPFCFLRSTLPSSELNRILETPSLTSLAVRGSEWQLKSFEGRPYQWVAWKLGDRGASEIRWPAALLRGSGVPQGDIAGRNCFQDLERSLVALSRGHFGTLSSLRRYLGSPGTAFEFDQSYGSHLDIYAPVFVRFASRPVLELATRCLRVAIESEEKHGFVLYVVHDDLQRALEFTSSDFARGTGTSLHLEATLPALAGPFGLQLVVDGVSVQRRRVGLPALASSLHALIDVDWEWLAGLRRHARKQSRGFEEYVAILLQLMGIPAVHYGQHGHLHRAPDLVAELDDEFFLVAECTVTSPTSLDIEELHGKAISLVQGLWEELQPAPLLVLFHASPHGAVNPDAAAKALERGVRLVGLAALESCERMLRRGEPREFVRSMLLETSRPEFE